LGNNFFLRFK